MNIKGIFNNKEVKKYLCFGVLTTIINYSVFAIGISFFENVSVLNVNVLAFSVATVFAFFTNKMYVFKENAAYKKKIWVEFIEFVFARLFSLGFEQMGLYIGEAVIQGRQAVVCGIQVIMILKILLSFIAVLMNYFASKFLVFTKRR